MNGFGTQRMLDHISEQHEHTHCTILKFTFTFRTHLSKAILQPFIHTFTQRRRRSQPHKATAIRSSQGQESRSGPPRHCYEEPGIEPATLRLTLNTQHSNVASSFKMQQAVATRTHSTETHRRGGRPIISLSPSPPPLPMETSLGWL